MVDEKVRELRTQFGDNAKYVALEVLDVLKRQYGVNAHEATVFWKKVKEKITPTCPKSPSGKHEYIMPADSFDSPYCKHCFGS